MIAFGIGLAVGFGLGWVVCARPAWATDLLEKAKAKWHSARS